MYNNETIDSIRSRFSCRSFSDKPVEREKIETVLDAAKYAPNGKNSQAWHFTVIQSEQGKQWLRDAAGKTPPPDFPAGKRMAPPGMPEAVMTWPFQADFCGADVVILISGSPDVPWPDIGPVLAAENLMVAATSLGLATLWSTTFTQNLFRDEESCLHRAELVPEGYDLKAAIFLGYPNKVPEKRPPRKGDVETWL